MLKLIPLLLLLVSTLAGKSQNIYSALHFHDSSTYRYGKPSQIIETNTFYSTTTTHVEKKINNYDDAGMLLTIESYDESGKLVFKRSNTNDTAKRLVLSGVTERRSKLDMYSKETTVYTYDANGFLTGIAYMDAAGNKTMVTVIVNNEKGNPVLLTLYNGHGDLYGTETATYFYDRNKAVTTVFAADGAKLSTDSSTINFRLADSTAMAKGDRNKQGDLLFYTSTNLNGTKTMYENEYVYDYMGNCTEEKIYKVTIKSNGKKKRTLDRLFTKQIIHRQQ